MRHLSKSAVRLSGLKAGQGTSHQKKSGFDLPNNSIFPSIVNAKLISILVLFPVLICSLPACELNSPIRDSRKDSFPWSSPGSSRTVAVTVTKSSGGAFSGKIAANSPLTQFLSIDGVTPVSGTQLSFPPGSLAIPTEVSVEEGTSIAVPSIQAAVGLVGNVAQSGTPVVISSSSQADPVAPFSIALNIPDAAALVETSLSYAVVYKIVRYRDGAFLTGVLPTSEISVTDRKAYFSASHFGVFQVIVTKTPVLEAKSVPVTAPIQTKAEVANLAPMEISGRSTLVVTAGQKVELRGKNFRSTMQLALGDKVIRGVNVVSDASASFVAPILNRFGLQDLSVDQDGVSQTITLVYRGGPSDLPIITMLPTEVCAGQKYYDALGQVQSGLKVCSAPPPPPQCETDGEVGCVTTTDYPAAEFSNLSAKVVVGATVAGVAGEVMGAIPPPPDCSVSGISDCVVREPFRAAPLCTGEGSDCYVPKYTMGSQPLKALSFDSVLSNAGGMRAAVTIAGVSGTLANCVSDGASDCVVGGSHVAVSQANLTAANIKSGVIIGGVTGTYPSSSTPLASNTSALDLRSFGAGTPIGSYEFFDSEGNVYSAKVEDLTVAPTASQQLKIDNLALYRRVDVAGDPQLIGGNIRVGKTIFGTVGGFAPPPGCSANGVTGCVTSDQFKSADLSNLSPGNIKSGVTIAGTAGAYPSSAFPLDPSSPSTGFTTGLSSNQLEDCSTDGAVNCIASYNFKAVSTANLNSGNIKSGVTIGGIVGAYPSVLHPLASDTTIPDLTSFGSGTGKGTYEFFDSTGQKYSATVDDLSIQPSPMGNTVSDPSILYRRVDVTGDQDLTAANIKSGVNVFNIAGTLQPRPVDCTTDGATGCVATTGFKAIKSANLTADVIKSGQTIGGIVGSFGPTCSADGDQNCLVSSGSTFKAANVSGIKSWDIRAGKTVAGISGSLVFYKNMVGGFNRTSGTGASAGADIYDTIDDSNNNNGSSPFIPQTNPWGGVTVAPGSNWTTVTAPCDGSGACVLRDETTGLLWAKADTTIRSWEQAISYCAGLNYGGYPSGWRLPSQKELLQAYVDGIWTNKTKLMLQKSWYWTSSTYSEGTIQAWIGLPQNGNLYADSKTTSRYVICVR